MLSSSNQGYYKLKTNLRLCMNRLKLLQKKKTELALKQRKEIANFIVEGKLERAKIRVEHIIREDNLVEAMEIVELYCDLLLTRFGLIQQMNTLDDGISEPVSSIIWIAPRLQSEVIELKVISNQLMVKYGKPYTKACQENSIGTVSEKLVAKLNIGAQPKLTIEKYLIEIAKYYNVEYEPDQEVMQADEKVPTRPLIDVSPFSTPSRVFSYPAPIQPTHPTSYGNGASSSTLPHLATTHGIDNINECLPPGQNSTEKRITEQTNLPPYSCTISSNGSVWSIGASLPEVPNEHNTNKIQNILPEDNQNKEGYSEKDDAINFDELTKRFEALKKHQ